MENLLETSALDLDELHSDPHRDEMLRFGIERKYAHAHTQLVQAEGNDALNQGA